MPSLTCKGGVGEGFAVPGSKSVQADAKRYYPIVSASTNSPKLAANRQCLLPNPPYPPLHQCHQLKHNQILFKFCGYLLDLCLFSLVSERFGRTGTTAFIRRFLISRKSRSRFMIDDAANISIAVLFNSAMVWVMFIR